MSFDEMRRRILREIERIHREIESAIEEIIEEVSERIEASKPMWSHEGTLEPLYSMYEYDDRYEVFLDLPGADLNTLSVTGRGKSLIVRCRLKTTICFPRWGTRQRELEFREYSKTIKLPDDADINTMKVIRRGTKIKIIVYKSS